VNVTGTGALVFVGVLALAVAILWFIPILYDLRKANQWRSTQQSELLDKMVNAASEKGLSVEDVRQIASAMNAPPRGVQGLTQTLLGLTITTLVGVAMVTTLVSTAADSSDLRKTIITALLSILGTIAGFYFGARTAQISSEQATRPPAPGGPSQRDASGPSDGPATDQDKVTEDTPPPSRDAGGDTEPKRPTRTEKNLKAWKDKAAKRGGPLKISAGEPAQAASPEDTSAADSSGS
jgi:hypothetical protein